jgi:hypothetical protein
MKVAQVNLSDIAKKAKNVRRCNVKSIVNEFAESDKAAVEIVMDKGEYSSPHACATTYQEAIRRYGLNSIKCICRSNRVYLVKVGVARQFAKMRSDIEAEKKRLESEISYELIASRHPEFKAMLDQYREMGGTLDK